MFLTMQGLVLPQIYWSVRCCKILRKWDGTGISNTRNKNSIFDNIVILRTVMRPSHARGSADHEDMSLDSCVSIVG